jgi:hypothetical protein
MEPSRVRLKTLLLGGTALVGIAAAPLIGDSRTALAACAVVPATAVACGPTTTVDTTFPVDAPNARNYVFDTPIIGLIAQGATASASHEPRPVDLWTTLRVAHRVHRDSNRNCRPEQNQKCVTHVSVRSVTHVVGCSRR